MERVNEGGTKWFFKFESPDVNNTSGGLGRSSSAGPSVIQASLGMIRCSNNWMESRGVSLGVETFLQFSKEEKYPILISLIHTFHLI